MKKMFMVALTSFSVLFVAQGALAESTGTLSDDDRKELEEKVNELFSSELEGEHRINNNESVTFEDFSIDLTESTLEEFDYNEERILESFEEHTQEIKDGFLAGGIELEKVEELEEGEPEFGIQSIVKINTGYKARVWAGVPAIGHGYINQNFRAGKRGNTVHSLSLQGSSYKEGFLVGTWSHQSSWFNKHQYSLGADIKMRGSMSYVYKGAPATYSATFSKSFTARDL